MDRGDVGYKDLMSMHIKTETKKCQYKHALHDLFTCVT